MTPTFIWYIGNTESKKCLKYGFAAGAAVGILAGITAGILIAPKSGKETRQSISEEIEGTMKKLSSSLEKKSCCSRNKEKAAAANTETSKEDN